MASATALWGLASLIDGTTVLRLTVGGLLLPHGLGKFLDYQNEVEAFGGSFGLRPARAWVIAVGITQIVCGVLLVANFAVIAAALLTAALMVGTIVVANRHAWFWHAGGAEYAVFWALAAVAVAAQAHANS